MGPIILVIYIYQLTFEFEKTFGPNSVWVNWKPFVDRLQWAMAWKACVAIACYWVLTSTLQKAAEKSEAVASGFVPEKVMAGSVFMKANKPKFQADVYGLADGKWLRSGQCFLSGEYLITANHVVSGYEKVKIVSWKGHFETEASVFEHVEGDLAISMMGADVIALLGLTSSTLIDMEPEMDSGLFVTATGFDQTSMGLVKTHPSFGFVRYTGSTVGGFSGAPYFCGNRVYGFHIGGCSENLGYSSAYVNMIIRYYREDTEDFVVQQAAHMGQFDYKQSPYSPDEFRVKVGRKYYNVDAEGLERMRSTGARATYIDRLAADYEPECAAATAFEKTTSEAVKILESNPPVVAEVPKAKLLISEAESKNFQRQKSSAGVPSPAGPSKKDQVTAALTTKKSKLRVITSSTPQKDSAGLLKTLAARNEVLQGMSKFSRKLRLAQSALPQQLSNKRLPALSSQSLDTQLISLQQEIEKLSQRLGSIMESTTSTTTAAQEQATTSALLR
uniref:Protease n=1 Tax=Baird Spence virus TaxID=1911089 RepID=A0A2Z2CBI1_9VIRU|nr:protease [Baird Spence virus]